MRKTIDENVIVPIPEKAHTCSDHRVYIVTKSIYYSDLKYNMDQRLWIGRAINDREMHPNDTYKRNYPDELNKVMHLNLPVYHKRVGVYVTALSIGKCTGLYSDLVKYMGPENANLVMDYAVFSIIMQDNTAKNFEAEMSGRMTFLNTAYSDSWISEKIRNAITDDQVQAFKNAWVSRFDKEKLKSVWICVDGSNNDCTADTPEAEKGKAKSHKNINIISFLYAVTEDGTPVTGQVYRGSRVDSKALVYMINLLKGYNIVPRGFILDRGFCDESCMNLLEENAYQYVIKLKENTLGFQTLLSEYRDTIKFNWDYALGHGLYGTGKTVKVFVTGKASKHCVLIWDAKNGGIRTDYLVDGLMETITDAEEAIASGGFPAIPGKFDKYIQVKEENGAAKLVIHQDLIQKDMDEKGFFGLICSEETSAREANRIYNLRDSSEKQYAILKSQLGGNTFRMHSMHGITVREVISFVASVIRNEMLKTCRKSFKPAMDTNKAIRELDLITMDLNPAGGYEITNQQSKRQKEILRAFGITEQSLKNAAAFENKRQKKEMFSPIQTLKSADEPAMEEKTVRVKGRPEGSKAKGKGAKSPDFGTTPKRKPGRPRKNTEKQAEPVNLKRGPGRPKGSKNKPKDPEALLKPKRGRGRPKGSKNKPKS